MRENLHVAMSAVEYHNYTSTSTGPEDQILISRVTEEFVPSAEGRTLVDVGTGTAVILLRLAASPHFETAKFIGFDYFGDMVELGRNIVEQAGLADRITVEQGDVHAMRYADNSIDYVISRSTIHHWADPVQAFREIYRILRPGGVAIIHDPRRDPNPKALEDFNRRRRAAGFEPNDLSEKYTPSEVAAFIEKAGIKERTMIAPEDGPASMGFEVYIQKPGS